MKKFFAIFLLLILVQWTRAQFNISGIINQYASVNIIQANSCGGTFTLDNASNFNIGDTVLIIQMQGASMNTTNAATFGDINAYGSAGLFEKNVIASKTGNDVTFGLQFLNTYNQTGSVQLVKIPHYPGNVTVNGVLTAADWDGTKGGILAFSASGNVTLSSNIDVRLKGFRGGSNVIAPSYSCNFITTFNAYSYALNTEFGAGKGEGVVKFNVGAEAGRGKQANGGGGGNDHNAGGGGGSNATSGGLGGRNDEPSFGCQGDFPGIGGLSLDYTMNRLFMGGGGGAGHGNNANYSAPDGAGIVIISANSITSSGGSILAQGNNGAIVSNDGGNGGSGGGAVFLKVNLWTASLTINISGGNGSNTANINNRCYGPGGGGGAGVFVHNLATYPNTLINAAGVSGVVTTSTNACNGSTLGATNSSGTGIRIANRTIPIGTVPTSSGPALTVGFIDTLFVCEGGTYIYNLGATAAQSYQWQIDSTGSWQNLPNNATYSNVTTNNGFQISNVTPNLENYSFRMLVYNACDTLASARIYVKVSVNPTIVVQPTGQTSCQGGSALFFAQVNNATSYQWQQLSGTFVNINDNATFSGTNTDSLVITNIPAGLSGAVFRLIATNSCISRFSTPVVLSFTTSPINISSQSANTNICAGNDTLLWFNATGVVDNIQWQVNTGSGFVNLSNSANYQGVNNDTLILNNVSLLDNGDIFRAIATNACAGRDTTNIITISVFASPSVSIVPNLNACQGNNVFVSISSITGSNITYQWQIDSSGTWQNLTNAGGYSNTTANFLAINGSIVTPALNSHLYRVIIDSDCGSAQSGSLQLNVVANPSIVTQPLNDTICLNANASISVVANNAASYQWQSNQSGSFVNLSNNATYSGVNSATLTINNVTALLTGFSFRVIITGNAPCLNVTSGLAQIVIGNQLIQVTNTSSNIIYCDGLDTSLTYSANGIVDNIQWQVNTGAGFVNLVNGTNHQNVNAQTLLLLNLNASLDGNIYRAILSNACSGADTTNPILIQRTPTPNFTFSANQSICQGENTSFVANTDYPIVSYQWQVLSGGVLVNVSNNATYQGVNTDSLIITNAPFSLNNAQYNVLLLDSCGNTSSKAVNFVLIVNPSTSSNVSLTLCNGDSLILSDGTVRTSSGLYADTLANANSNGCDSIVNYNLTILPLLQTNQTLSICANDSFQLPSGSFVNTPGVYVDTLVSSGPNACDSIVQTTLTVFPLAINTIIDSFCLGGSYTLVSGTVVTTAGIYQDTLLGLAINACDSFITYNISVNIPPAPTTILDTICFNETYTLPSGAIVNTAGLFVDTLVAVSGCDSLINIQLTVLPANAIVQEGNSLSPCPGNNALFFAESNLSNVTYQWFVNGLALPGETNDSLVVLNVAALNNNQNYFVRIISACDTLQSSTFNLQVKVLAQFTVQANNQILCEGDDAIFFVNTNIPVNSYTWLENGLPLVNSNNDSLLLPSVSIAQSGNSYACVFVDSCGNTDTSLVANLTVRPNLAILAQSANLAVCENENALFWVNASGFNQSYQWFENGVLMPGETNDSLILFNLSTLSDGFVYACQVNSVCGNLTSNNFTLNVDGQSALLNQSADLTICGGFNFELFVEATEVSSYQWQINQGAGFVNLVDGLLLGGPAQVVGSNTANLVISNYNLNISGAQFQVLMNVNCGLAPIFVPVSVNITSPVIFNQTQADTLICETEVTALFIPYVSGNAVWSNGNIGQFLVPEFSGLYTVSFTDANACPASDTILITLEDCLAKCVVTAPTGFSPNIDGANDIFKAIYTCPLSFYELKIYNRYGELVFQSSEPLKGWDGVFKGRNAEIGVYAWTLRYQKEGLDFIDELKGQVTLLR
jgi:gliding motility-associated-like protein